MGGGRGTRLYPLTKERCKPAVPLAGKYRLVDIPISNCLNSGVNRIFLLTQFNTASLHRHIQNTYNFDAFGGGFVDILSAEQTEKTTDWYQGTADAVRRNLTHFRTRRHDLVLILSGDQLYRMDFHKIIDQHIRTGADVTLAAIALPTSQIEGLGLMRVRDDLSVESFVEKPKDPAVIQSLAVGPAIQQLLKTKSDEKRCLASMGIYVFNREVLQQALDNTMTDFGKEIIPALLGKKRLFSHIFEGYWEDIGTVRAFFDANLQLTDPTPAFNFFSQVDPVYTRPRYLPASKINKCMVDHAIIGDGCLITDASMKRCVVGIRSVMREGCRLEDTVMMGADYYETENEIISNASKGVPNVGLGRNCNIRTAIIDKNARIGDNVTLNPAGKPNGHVREGIAIVDGVLVVTKDAIVPAGTVV
jgi:glucose-1-phosphate adenylyltransferase